MDIGYEAPTAFVLAGYSNKYRQLRHVWDFSGRHMLTHEIASMIKDCAHRFGHISRIYADAAGLGESMVAEMQRDYGLPIEKSKKREKQDYIEQLNNAFALGEVLIIPNDPDTGKQTTLETQLLTNAWDLDDDTKENLGRLGKLVEDKNIPNDSTDALVYLFRGSMHRFGATKKVQTDTPGTPEYFAAWEANELKRMREEFRNRTDPRLSNSQFIIPRMLRGAFRQQSTLPEDGRWTSSTPVT